MKRLIPLLWLFSFALVAPAQAFFLTVIQETGQGFGKRGEELSWLIFRSEPFAGVIYDLKAPKAKVFSPSGDVKTLPLRRTKVFDHLRGQKRYAWRTFFLPDRTGDYFLVFETEPTLVPGLGEVWQEWVKVPLHVTPGQNWRKDLGLKVEIVPLTQPYGLEAEAVFCGRLLLEGKPLPHTMIQIVTYHGRYLAPDILPKNAWGQRENARMYHQVVTDELGYFTVSFNKSGWWLISARVPYGNYKIGGLAFPLFLRASLWLYVFPPYNPPENAPWVQADPK